MFIPLVAMSNNAVVSDTEQESVSLSSYWSSNVARWSDLILQYATEHSIDPDMIAAVMTMESGGNPDALSGSGAMGLMQVMPFHSCSSWEPEQNISCGVGILAYYEGRAEDWTRGLAAYNAGETGRDVYGRGYGYAEKVLALYENSK